MDPRTAATRVPDPDAVEFIRFCYRRRRVGWPELYDEMCAVAGRGLFRGYGADDLAALGIGFSLFDMPALAALSNEIVAEEVALRRPVTVTITPMVVDASEAVEADVEAHAMAAPASTDLAFRELAATAEPAAVTLPAVTPVPSPIKDAASPAPLVRFSPVPAGV